MSGDELFFDLAGKTGIEKGVALEEGDIEGSWLENLSLETVH